MGKPGGGPDKKPEGCVVKAVMREALERAGVVDVEEWRKKKERLDTEKKSQEKYSFRDLSQEQKEDGIAFLEKDLRETELKNIEKGLINEKEDFLKQKDSGVTSDKISNASNGLEFNEEIINNTPDNMSDIDKVPRDNDDIIESIEGDVPSDQEKAPILSIEEQLDAERAKTLESEETTVKESAGAEKNNAEFLEEKQKADEAEDFPKNEGIKVEEHSIDKIENVILESPQKKT